jgi:hypothetical protein
MLESKSATDCVECVKKEFNIQAAADFDITAFLVAIYGGFFIEEVIQNS